MPVDTTATVRIACPPERVAEFLRDPANDPRWIGGIRTAQLVTPAPVGVGTRVARVASFLGKKIEYVNEITALTPDGLAMRSVQSPFPMQVDYGHRADGAGGTAASVRVRGEAGRFYRLAAPVLNRMVHRSISGDLRRLKRVLEG